MKQYIINTATASDFSAVLQSIVENGIPFSTQCTIEEYENCKDEDTNQYTPPQILVTCTKTKVCNFIKGSFDYFEA